MSYAEVRITPGIVQGYAVDCQRCAFYRLTTDDDVARALQAQHVVECTARPRVPLSREKRREAQRRQARIEKKLAC